MRHDDKDHNNFFHILTGIRSLKAPIKVSIKGTAIQSFKDYLKDKQSDGDVRIKEISRELILLPKFSEKLIDNDFALPNILRPLFADHSKIDEQKAYA